MCGLLSWSEWRGASLRSASDEPHRDGEVPFGQPTRVEWSERRRNSPRRYVRFGRWAFAFDITLLVILAINLHGPVRLLFGLIFALLIPGWSIVGRFRLENPALEFALTVAASLAILTISAQILLTIHWWHLWAFDLIAAILCAGPLAWQGGIIAPIRESKWR